MLSPLRYPFAKARRTFNRKIVCLVSKRFAKKYFWAIEETRSVAMKCSMKYLIKQREGRLPLVL